MAKKVNQDLVNKHLSLLGGSVQSIVPNVPNTNNGFTQLELPLVEDDIEEMKQIQAPKILAGIDINALIDDAFNRINKDK